MGPEHSPKGAVVPNKERKFASILDILPDPLTIEAALEKFRELYPEDWRRVESRYAKHERMSKPGKGHPMPPPREWFDNTFGNYAKKQGHTIRTGNEN